MNMKPKEKDKIMQMYTLTETHIHFITCVLLKLHTAYKCINL